MTPHESHVRARDFAAQPEVLEQGDVETGRIEATARHRHEVGHTLRTDSRVYQRALAGRERQGVRLGFKAAHAIQCGRVPLVVERLARCQIAIGRFEHDAVSRDHTRSTVDALEQPPLRIVRTRKLLRDLGGILLANPIGWYGRSDPGNQHGHAQLAVE